MNGSDQASSERWPEWASASPPRDLAKRKSLFTHFARWMAKNVSILWSGTDDASHTQDYLETQLSSLLSTESDITTHRIFTNWWDILLSEGFRLKRWNVRPGSQRVKLPPESPVFVRRDFQLLASLRTLESAWLNRVCGTLEPERLYDALLLSAVLNGGILSADRLAGLLDLHIETIHEMDGLLWMTLDLNGSRSVARPVRWFPDAITATILVRILNHHSLPAPPKKPIDGAAARTRLRIACENLRLPAWNERLDDLFRTARVSTALNVPGFVAAYLADDIECHSLPEAVFQRVCRWEQVGIAPTPDTLSPAIPEERTPLRLEASFDPNLPRDSQMSVARKVCKALNKKHGAVERLKAILAENKNRLWPITHALINWTIWRLEPGSPLGVIKASSAETYFRTLAVHLIYEAEDLELLDLDIDDFETLYELAGKRISTETRRPYFWARLRDFHYFLFLCGAPDIDFRELDGWTASGPVRVSANLVTEREFQCFKDALEIEKARDAGTMVFLAGMLAYRTGLRRREVQMLRIQDIHPGSEPFLLIRPSKLATLKSNSSKRRIPLRPLLPVDELDALMAFHERRKLQIDGETGLLFSDPDAPWTPLPHARLIDPVTALFGAITGQIGMPFRFHHLRHSFANWMLLALLSMDEPRLLARNLPCVDSPLLAPERLELLRNCLYPRTATACRTYPDRRHVFQVAALMGHLSPVTTFQSYLHQIDWLSGQYLDVAHHDRLQTLGAQQLGALCDLSGSMPYKGKYRELIASPVDFMRHFVHNRAGDRKVPLVNQQAESRSLPALDNLIKPGLPSPALMVTLLARYFSGKSPESLAQNFAVPAEAITAAAQAYKRLYAKQSVRTEKRDFFLPQPPRTTQDQKEYFRIVRTTFEAFKNEKKRPALSAAAEAIIQRTGPRTGHVYFGTKGRDPLMIIEGLCQMGISPNEMRIVVRRPDTTESNSEHLAQLLNAAKSIGIEQEEELLEWKKRSMKNTLLQLKINDTRLANNEEPIHWEGRIRGINYAAVWLRLVTRT